MEEAESHFEFLMNSQRAVGSQDSAVLCQEFLKGKEYVVDHVSRDGEHKTVMIYVYDKRPANGSQFVYHGMLPVASDSKVAQDLISYTRGVLDAIGIKHGPTHTEIMMTEDGPCLVEVNCRAHGGDGTWAPLAKALTGSYCQVDASIDAFLDQKKFLALPDVYPSMFAASGLNLMLVCNEEGVVQAMPGYDRIRKLRSFVKLQTGIRKGAKVERTVDLLTCIGQVILIHPDPDILAEDVSVIRQMEKDCAILNLEKHRKMSAALLGA
jgi:biotin carboxylase